MERAAPFTMMNGTIVTTFLANLNGGGGFAGHIDWRIPNRFELDSLVQLHTVNPATHSQFDSGCVGGCTVSTCSCTRSSSYWSSTTYPPAPQYAWIVSLGGGFTNLGEKIDSTNYFVRAVRGGS